MNMDKKALKLVTDLNSETFLDGVLEYHEPFEFRSTGNECGIYFLNIILWTDENDEREWMNDDEKESLRTYIVRESKKILTDLNMRVLQL